MPSKTDLEAQVEALKLEVESLKSAQPADVVALKKELTDADVQAALAKAILKEEIDKLKAEAKAQALELITSTGETQAALEKVQALEQVNERLQAQLNIAKQKQPDVKGEQATAGDIMLRVRTSRLHENQKCLILEE